MTRVYFVGPFRIPGGPMYVQGDHAIMADDLAEQAMAQGAAIHEEQAAAGMAAPDHPPAHKMVQRGRRKATDGPP